MDEKKAKELLHDCIEEDDHLYLLDWYLEWMTGENHATLDGIFEAEELEAIAWWMKNKGKERKENGKEDSV